MLELYCDNYVKMNSEKKKSNIAEQVDKKLIKAFLDNDMAAFDKLVVKYKNMIFNLCFRFLNDHDEADDCAQDTFVKVYRSLSRFKYEASFSTWLYRIAVNTCKNKIASLKYRIEKQMVRLDKPRQSDNGEYQMEVGDNKHSPEKFVERKEQGLLLQNAIDSLPAKQKQMVLLRDVEGLAYDQIGEITGDKLGTVKSKLARAREMLRNKLRGVI